MSKFDCYKCIHRRSLPGDCHSECAHPDANLLEPRLPNKLGITGDPHGIKMGWFFWPLNFDPIWLRSCNGFQTKTPFPKPGDDDATD